MKFAPIQSEQERQQETFEIFEAAILINEAIEQNITGKEKSQEKLISEWFPRIPAWKIYNARRILAYYKHFELQIGKRLFLREPLWKQLTKCGLNFSSLYLLTEERYQKAPLWMFIQEILKTKDKTFSELEKSLLQWFSKNNFPLGRPKERKIIKKPHSQKIQEIEPQPEKKKKTWPECLPKERLFALLQAGEEIVQKQETRNIPQFALTSYMREHYPNFGYQQLYQAIKIVRNLPLYGKEMEGNFQFDKTPIYFQLAEKDVTLSALYTFAKEYNPHGFVKETLQDLLLQKKKPTPESAVAEKITGEIALQQVSPVQKTKSTEINTIVENTTDEAAIQKEEMLLPPEQESTKPQEETKKTTPLLFKEMADKFSLHHIRDPHRYHLKVHELQKEKKKIILQSKEKFTQKSLYPMMIFVLAQGSNGIMVVSHSFAYYDRNHHNQEFQTHKEISYNQNNQSYIEKKVQKIRQEMELSFKKKYPEEHIVSSEGIYAQSRKIILEYLEERNYHVVDIQK